VFVRGALVWTWDSHAAQGNGEVNLTAIETAFQEINVTITVDKTRKLEWPRIETENDWIAMGFDENLGKALDAAKSETAKLIAEQRNIGAEQGLSTPRCAQLARALRLALPRSAEGDARTCQCLGTELIDGWVRPET
jgi:acetamidase/formamidase